MVDLEAMYVRQSKDNLEIAFNFAEKEFNVTKLLDAEGITLIRLSLFNE